jgi:hypothetical protein
MVVSKPHWSQPIPSKSLLIVRCTFALTERPAFALGATARAIRLQQMRQRVDVAQLPVLDAEEVGVGRSAAAVRASRPERAEDHYGANGFVNDEVPVRNIDAARHADLAGIIRSSLGAPLPVCAPPSVRLQG